MELAVNGERFALPPDADMTSSLADFIRNETRFKARLASSLWFRSIHVCTTRHKSSCFARLPAMCRMLRHSQTCVEA